MYRHAVDIRISPGLAPTIKKAWLRNVAIKALQLQRILEQAELSITLTTDEEVARLNEQYRGIATSTDVLSFPMDEDAGGDGAFITPEGVRMLGDVVISYPRAVKQAGDYGHSVEREVAFLTVHGILHLLGMDHQTPEQEKEMFGRQEAILESLGLKRAAAAT